MKKSLKTQEKVKGNLEEAKALALLKKQGLQGKIHKLTDIAKEISTKPSAKASEKSPLDVSSDIAVVNTRVALSILPPTIIMAPTSPIPRPNPAKQAVIKALLLSHINVPTRCIFDMFMEIRRLR